MKISIEGKEVELKYSFRGLMIYEKITGESFSPKGVTEIMVYFYSTILASDKDLVLGWESFVDWVDENPNLLNEFSEWLTEVISRNSIFSEDEGGEKKPLKKK